MNLGRTARGLTWLTAGVALAVSLVPPTAHFLVQREGLTHSLAADANVQAALISNVAGRNPAIWKHAHERLIEAIAPVANTARRTRIVDEYGATLVELPAELRWPVVERAEVFYESGFPAGRVAVAASLAGTLLETAFVFLISASFGFLVYVTLRRMPARALKRASESLIRGQLSRSLVDGLTVGVLLTDFNHRIVAANQCALGIAGRLAPDRKPACVADFLADGVHEGGTPFPPDDWPMLRCIRSRQAEGPVVIGVRDAAGGTVWLAVKSVPVKHGEAGEYDAVVSSIEDVTERKRNADQLAVTQHAVMSAHDSIFITDGERRILIVNNAFTALSGFSAEEVLGKTPSVLRSGMHDEKFYAAMWQAITTEGRWSGEIWNRHKDGHVYPAWLSIGEVRDAHGRLVNYIGTHFDISERLSAEQKVRHMAHHDPLTGLPNRAFLRETLGQALSAAHRHGWRVGVFFIDLDRFKLVNDSMGHQAGDAVLVEVARRLKASSRDEDTIGRLAGDEFVAFMPKIESGTALLSIAGNMLQAMARPIFIDGREVDISTSIGIAVYPDDGLDVDTLLSKADTAMYAAKEDGRANFKFFTPAMNEAGSHELETIRDVKAALDRDEFVLYYQPQVSVADDVCVCGAEALIRWNHPTRGLVPPGEFIPIIEGTRLIVEVGDWVLEQAMRQSRKWRERGHPLRLSVNVSALQFRQDDFIEKLTRLAERHPDCVALISLEVTEGLMLDEQQSTLEKMNEIKRLGFGLALDDFGTGYSSLAYLTKFPFDELKIDRSFVSRLESDKTVEAIADAILAMSRALNLEAVAEGVETDGESKILRRLGCRRIQGFLFGKPMTEAAFEQYLLRSAPAGERPGGGIKAVA